MRTQKLLLLALGCAWAMGVCAQWQWVDKDGRKVFSDRPPPQEIPEKDILKQPGGRAAVRAPAPSVATDGAAVVAAGGASAPRAAASAPRLGGGTDKELDQKKKQSEDADAAKRKAEEQRVAKIRSESCNQARSAKATMDSGVRVSRANAKGEQEIFDENARDAENKRLQGIINSECK
jgi:Domain of unknown function (DUF4124)